MRVTDNEQQVWGILPKITEMACVGTTVSFLPALIDSCPGGLPCLRAGYVLNFFGGQYQDQKLRVWSQTTLATLIRNISLLSWSATKVPLPFRPGQRSKFYSRGKGGRLDDSFTGSGGDGTAGMHLDQPEEILRVRHLYIS